MAIENTNPITYADWAKTRDPDGTTADIVELLAQSNPIIQDAAVREGNLTVGHRTTVRTGYGASTWRKLNFGVQPSKSTNKQVDDSAGMLEDYVEVDKALAELEDDRAAFLLSESRAKLEEMSQTHATTLFYGDTSVNPERFLGLTERFNDATADNARNILDGKKGGASGSSAIHTSLWLVTWGLDTCFEFFPKGSMVGLQSRDLGEHTLFDANGGRYQGYRIHYKHDVGLVVRDWRYLVRIANLDPTQLIGADLNYIVRLMITAINKLQTLGVGRPAFYGNRALVTALDLAANEKTNVQLRMMEWGSEQVVGLRGIPIRMCEALDVSDELPVLGLPTLV